MIIECVNCFKKFNVDSQLIPDEGRTIQCGVCSHVWFFDKALVDTSKISNPKVEKKEINELSQSLNEQTEDQIDSSNGDDMDLFGKKNYKNTNVKSKNNFTAGRLLSYIIVSIISFIAIILIIDTFKILLYDIFPNLEFFLFSFYETLKDLILFISDLI